MRNRSLLPLGVALALVLFAGSIVAGMLQGGQQTAYATGCSSTEYTAGCIFYPCSGMDAWGSSRYAVEYDFMAFPWLKNGGSETRERRMSWQDTSIGGTSWPPMVVSAWWVDHDTTYITKAITVTESGTVSGDTSYIRLWKNNNSVTLCDGYTGKNQKAMISTENGACIGNVYYHIDVIDKITSGGDDYCLGQVQVETLATSALLAKNAQTCPTGTARTYVGADDPFVISCSGLSMVPWNYELQ